MSDPLDSLLQRLRVEDDGRSLHQLETDVILKRRRLRDTGRMIGLRAAATLAALLLGVGIGGVTGGAAIARQQATPLDDAAALLPSTLLGGAP